MMAVAEWLTCLVLFGLPRQELLMEAGYFVYLLNFIGLEHENFKDFYAVVRKGLIKLSFNI